MLDFLKRPPEDVRIELPGIEVAFNHRLKVAFLFCHDPNTPDHAYDALEKHFARKGYFLQILVPSASVQRVGRGIPIDIGEER